MKILFKDDETYNKEIRKRLNRMHRLLKKHLREISPKTICSVVKVIDLLSTKAIKDTEARIPRSINPGSEIKLYKKLIDGQKKWQKTKALIMKKFR